MTSGTARPRPRSGPAPKRFGRTEARIYTPPLRRLTRRTTLGFECADFAENILGIHLLPWQRWFLLAALELHPTEVGLDGGPLFRFRKVLLLVGRQSGKSTVMQALTLWRMFVDRCSLVIGTAQDLEVAESLWAEAVELAESVEELSAEIAEVYKGSGKKQLLLRTGEAYKVKAVSRRGGRGLSGELVLLDELREHQSWQAWAAVTKTTNAKERAQIYGISNAGDASSIVLRYLRKMAHSTLGDPDGINAGDDPAALLAGEVDAGDLDLSGDDSLGIFEWSAPPGCDVWDRDGWEQSTPALGYLIRESTLASDARTDPEWVFRTEVLCQWSSGSLEGPFPPGAWQDCLDVGSFIPAGEPFAFCVDVSWDRTASHVGVAGRRPDGLLHVEVVASRAGTDWVIPWLVERKGAPGLVGVALQAKGAPVSSLLQPMRDAGLAVVEWAGSDLGPSTGAFYDLVRSGGLRHLVQPILDVAAATARVKPISDSYVWDRKASPVDAAPLVAVTGAAWAVNRPQPREQTSAYEDHDLVVV